MKSFLYLCRMICRTKMKKSVFIMNGFRFRVYADMKVDLQK